MRTGHLTGTALAAVLVLGMTGCVGGDPLPTLPPTPSTTPVFASEEEALAAAEEAYAAYLAMSNLISSEGGAEPERIAPFVTEEQLPDELDGSSYLRENGLRSVGQPTLSSVVLQQQSQVGGRAEVVAYVCVDVSAVRVLDSANTDVTPSDRPNPIALEVLFEADTESVLIADTNQWPDSSICL